MWWDLPWLVGTPFEYLWTKQEPRMPELLWSKHWLSQACLRGRCNVKLLCPRFLVRRGSSKSYSNSELTASLAFSFPTDTTHIHPPVQFSLVHSTALKFLPLRKSTHFRPRVFTLSVYQHISYTKTMFRKYIRTLYSSYILTLIQLFVIHFKRLFFPKTSYWKMGKKTRQTQDYEDPNKHTS